MLVNNRNWILPPLPGLFMLPEFFSSLSLVVGLETCSGMYIYIYIQTPTSPTDTLQSPSSELATVKNFLCVVYVNFHLMSKLTKKKC